MSNETKKILDESTALLEKAQRELLQKKAIIEKEIHERNVILQEVCDRLERLEEVLNSEPQAKEEHASEELYITAKDALRMVLMSTNGVSREETVRRAEKWATTANNVTIAQTISVLKKEGEIIERGGKLFRTF